MKLNPSFTAVSSLFVVDATTIAAWWDEIIQVLAELSKNGIMWWPREQIKARMPAVCKEICPEAV